MPFASTLKIDISIRSEPGKVDGGGGGGVAALIGKTGKGLHEVIHTARSGIEPVPFRYLTSCANFTHTKDTRRKKLKRVRDCLSLAQGLHLRSRLASPQHYASVT